MLYIQASEVAFAPELSPEAAQQILQTRQQLQTPYLYITESDGRLVVADIRKHMSYGWKCDTKGGNTSGSLEAGRYSRSN